MKQWIKRHRVLVAAGGAIAASAVVFVLVWFQPQKLFIDERVDEALPGLSAPEAAATTGAPTTAAPETTTTTSPSEATIRPGPATTTVPTTTVPTTTTTTTAAPVAPAGPVTLHTSEFIDVGHSGTGDVLLVELPDGTRVIRFENLDVSNGPDLRVILSPSPLVDDRDAYDDGDFYDLGELKGNRGNQNYEIPRDVDLADYQTVAIWCRRFNYTFNAAPLT